MHRYPPQWHDGGAGHHWLFVVFVIALVAGVVLLVLALLRMRHADGSAVLSRPSPTSAAGVDQALAELRLRYARGDIDREDYLRRAVDLGDTSAVTPPAPPAVPPTDAAPPPAPPAQA